ncbi:hypothetical protein BKA83DRAFT_4129811 [Pisolithus microcarpus]|nr:hypothetical protein BKA83DRAFT_4129811 [Pisolithus microcarpus]
MSGIMSSLLTPNESNGLLLASSSPTSMTFQPSFPLPHVPDVNFSQGNEMAMTSFPTFMNGAYSHESKQLSLLQERAKLLEGQIVKLTIENNTLKTAFQCLAGAVGLRDMDPCQVDGTTFPQATASLKSKVELAPPTPTNYPSIRFWDREDWDKYLESPEGQTSKRGTMGYLEDKDGNPPSREMAKAIRKLLRGGWVELVHRELVPPSWGRLSTSTRQFIHGLMEKSDNGRRVADGRDGGTGEGVGFSSCAAPLYEPSPRISEYIGIIYGTCAIEAVQYWKDGTDKRGIINFPGGQTSENFT